MSLLSIPNDTLCVCFAYADTKELITRIRLVNKRCKTASELKLAWTNSHLEFSDERYLLFTPYLKSLFLYVGSNQRVVNLNNLPCGLTNLKFGGEFNQPVNNLPSGLTHLTFGLKFNQPVNNLPAGLTHLRFHEQFNQPVDNLPASLTHLSFSVYFNQPVDHLPAGLTHLELFGCKFDQPVNNLPAGLTHLRFGTKFNQ